MILDIILSLLFTILVFGCITALMNFLIVPLTRYLFANNNIKDGLKHQKRYNDRLIDYWIPHYISNILLSIFILVLLITIFCIIISFTSILDLLF